MNKQMNGLWKAGQKGFTIIEIIVVVTIIALLVSAVGFQLGKTRKQAQGQATSMALASIDQALERFKMDFNVYPTLADDNVENGAGIATDATTDWKKISKALCASSTDPNDTKNGGAELNEVLAKLNITVDPATIENIYNGPYLKGSKGVKLDGWKNDFVLKVDNTTGAYIIYSKGEKAGDPNDDIVSDGSQLDK